MKNQTPIQPHELLACPPAHDFRFEYKGMSFHKFMSACNVKIWELPDHKLFVLLTDLGEGTSVTNAAEEIIQQLYAKRFVNKLKTDLIFAEMYTEEREEPIDVIVPTWNGDEVTDVNWKRLGIITLA